MRFRKHISYNGKDWKMAVDSAGRTHINADGAGVYYRMGLVITFLHNNPGSTAREAGIALQKKHTSYTVEDAAHPLRRLVKAGLVETKGQGPATTYTLTRHAKMVWGRVKPEWM